jgi:flavin-dependent dehydrogenase
MGVSMPLEPGARVAVVGGGPSGSLFSYFLLTLGRRADLDLTVDIYEPHDFTMTGPIGCNMCGGIVSESLIQVLATEGINLPATVVQRGIDSYVLHTRLGSVRLETPLHEKRIAAVHRGGGPRDAGSARWESLDAHLLGLAGDLGANVIRTRVKDLGWDGGRPRIETEQGSRAYDLVAGAIGVKAGGWGIFERLGFTERGPRTEKTYITELHFDADTISGVLGNSMHLFLLDDPRIDCAAAIPKGEFVTVCLLGHEIDKPLIERFFADATVRSCFPPGSPPGPGACHCAPRIAVREARRPYADRVVLIGDCGVTRLYKDGLGAAYRTAKAAALTAVFDGVSAEDFGRRFLPTYRAIARDNRYGSAIFAVTSLIRRAPLLLRGMLRMLEMEQARPPAHRRMTIVLWDMFTGSAPYREIFARTLDPRFAARYLADTVISFGRGTPIATRTA